MAKQNSRIYFIITFLLFSSILRTSANIDYYPDKFKDDDMIYSSADPETIYILRAGYFSKSNKVIDPYLRTQGITLDKDTSVK